MSDHDEDDELPPDDHEVFDLTNTKVDHLRSKDQTKVDIRIRDKNGISEMKLYLIYDMEMRKLERRLGICDEDPTKEH